MFLYICTRFCLARWRWSGLGNFCRSSAAFPIFLCSVLLNLICLSHTLNWFLTTVTYSSRLFLCLIWPNQRFSHLQMERHISLWLRRHILKLVTELIFDDSDILLRSVSATHFRELTVRLSSRRLQVERRLRFELIFPSWLLVRYLDLITLRTLLVYNPFRLFGGLSRNSLESYSFFNTSN